MKNLFYGAVLALQFLTRIPLPVQCEVNDHSLKWALRFYPFAGGTIGVVLSVFFLLFSDIFPLYIVALGILSLWLFLTGGLHVDGFMDVADAVGSNGNVEKKQEIMKDSRVGSFAVIALFFLLAWKCIVLFELLRIVEEGLWLYLLLIPILARFQALMQLYFFQPFQKKGMAYFWKSKLDKKDLWISFGWIFPFLWMEQTVLLIVLLQFVFSWLFGKWATKQFQGINGDTVGASIEGAELWNLFVVYVLFLLGME
jgi:adenosylcobinamide-GDP ribazoletransferase